MPPDAHAQHALARSLRRLAVDVVRDRDARLQSTMEGRFVEREEQVQIDVHGQATGTPLWQTVSLDFSQSFTTALGRRDSELERPHTWFGYVLRSASRAGAPTAGGVILAAVVTGWTMDAGRNIVGATVAVCAHAPGDTIDFHGTVDATFQGYGVLREPHQDEGG